MHARYVLDDLDLLLAQSQLPRDIDRPLDEHLQHARGIALVSVEQRGERLDRLLEEGPRVFRRSHPLDDLGEPLAHADEQREIVVVEGLTVCLVVHVDDADHDGPYLEWNAYERFRLVLWIVGLPLDRAPLDVPDEERLSRFDHLARYAAAEGNANLLDDLLPQSVCDLYEQFLLLLIEQHHGDHLDRKHLGDDLDRQLEHLLDLLAGLHGVEQVPEQVVEMVLLRQGERETASLPDPARHVYEAAVLLYDVFHDREPQAHALTLAPRDLVELSEDILDVLFRYADPLVPDRDLDRNGILDGLDGYARAFFGKLDRIPYEVDEDLTYEVVVAVHHRQVGLEIDDEPEAFVDQVGLHRRLDLLDELAQIEHLALERALAEFDLRNVEDLVDHSNKPVGLRRNDLEEIVLLLECRIAEMILQRFHIGLDGRERRLQLVREVRDITHLQFIGVLQALVFPLEPAEPSVHHFVQLALFYGRRDLAREYRHQPHILRGEALLRPVAHYHDPQRLLARGNRNGEYPLELPSRDEDRARRSFFGREIL